MTNTQPTSTTPKEPERIIVFDTTLRDGEQAPGNTMFDWEKLEIADALTRAKVDIIESGFPASSRGDYVSVNHVANELANRYGTEMPIVAGLAMAKKEHIEVAARALEPAIRIGRGRIHTFIASSEIHADVKLRKTQEEILEMAKKAVKLAKSYTSDVEFSPEDASRTGIDFLLEITEAAAIAGATTINIPDTVGYAVPEEFGEMVRRVKERIGKYGVVISTHCHNDLGMAVANSLTGLMNGARQAEVAINGIGERAGNASLEQLVMGIRTRKDYYGGKKGVYTRFDNEFIGELSGLVSMAIGSWPSRNTPIVGENAFSHQAGIHQDGMTKGKNTYEIMDPKSVGWVGESYIAGKHSGKAGTIAVLKDLGYENGEHIEEIREKVKEIAVKQKCVFDNDIRKIVEAYGLRARKPIIKFDLDNVVYTRVVNPAIRMNLSWNEIEKMVPGQGNGPIHAAYSAIKEYVGNGIELLSFRINAVGSGEKAMAESRVTIKRNGRRYVSRGGHSDIVVAAISAYVNAINRSIVDVD